MNFPISDWNALADSQRSALLAREKDDIEAALTLAREALALEPLNLQHQRRHIPG